jgi:Flp pilus assembly protein TadG
MNTKHSREHGQAMILMAIGFVVFLGFVALAIDGGMVYSERRRAQNGSDAASLAGGGTAALSLENSHVVYANWNCADSRIADAEAAAIAAAISRASSNKYTIDDNIADINGVTTVCGEDSTYGYVDKYIDVTVDISDSVKTNFAQVLFNGKFRNQVEAITRVRPRSPLAFGHAVVALNEESCQGNQSGVSFGGSSDVDINGGGVWSNGCLRGVGGAYNVDVQNGAVNYVIDPPDGTMNFNPDPTNVPHPLPPSSFEVPAPDCSDPNAHHLADLNLHNGTLNLDPGLYCISGDITINGGTITGEGVTFYLESGEVSINGNAEVSLSSPATTPDPSPAIGGMLFYVATGDISLEGNSTSAYLGVIYAPVGTIDIAGSNGTTPTFNTQLVGYNVHVSGNADIDINFNPEQQYARPTSIELWK